MLLWGQREREVTYLVIRRVRDSLPVEEEDLKKKWGGAAEGGASRLLVSRAEG